MASVVPPLFALLKTAHFEHPVTEDEDRPGLPGSLQGRFNKTAGLEAFQPMDFILFHHLLSTILAFVL